MLHGVLNKSWEQRQHKKLYGHLPPITQTIQIRWIKHAEYYRRSKDELISNMDSYKWTHQHWSTSKDLEISALYRQDAVKKTCQVQWLIETDGKRESGNSMLSVQLDDDDVIY